MGASARSLFAARWCWLAMACIGIFTTFSLFFIAMLSGESAVVPLITAGIVAANGLTAWLLVRQINRLYRSSETHRRVLEDEALALLQEKQIIQARLHELDRVKHDLVSSVSHELRTPLTSTLGFLELLLEGDAGELTPPQAHMVEVANRNGKRLLSMIEDLLTLSRIESGAFNVQFRTFDITNVITQVVEQWRPTADQSSISLDLNIGSAACSNEQAAHILPRSTHDGMKTMTTPVYISEIAKLIEGDEHQLLRAIGNVVGNAVKFTESGGQVNVQVSCAGENVAISVSDSGIGIPIEEQGHLFSRFFRSSTSTQRAHQGAGLGLIIARTIIEHHNGNIDIHSQPGVGTTVTIRLPVRTITTQTQGLA